MYAGICVSLTMELTRSLSMMQLSAVFSRFLLLIAVPPALQVLPQALLPGLPSLLQECPVDPHLALLSRPLASVALPCP